MATQFQVLPKLLKLLNDPQRNDADFRAVTENAVSALGSMCQGRSRCPPGSDSHHTAPWG